MNSSDCWGSDGKHASLVHVHQEGVEERGTMLKVATLRAGTVVDYARSQAREKDRESAGTTKM